MKRNGLSGKRKSKDNLTIEERDWRLIVRDHVLRAQRPLIAILGPTASGKTSFSIQVAQYIDRDLKENFAEWRSGAEIVNADSRQLYRGMDIGTAKIREAEMDKIPHHLVDVLDPEEDVTIAWYKEHAERCIDDILARGNIPLLVGGSMLYVSAVVDNLQPLPSDPDMRRTIEEEYERDGGVALHDHLAAIDPKTARSFHHRNKPYVVRATELARMTNERPSDVKMRGEPRFDTLIFGVHQPQAALERRIEERTIAMLDSGWIEEVENLVERGIPPDAPGMKSTGYREIAAWLQNPDSMSREEVTDIIIRKTRQYAKRQMTWWKGDERIHWIQPE